MKSLTPRLAVALLVACLAIGVASPALAAEEEPATDQETATIGGLKAHCQRAIERRLNDLANGQIRLDGAQALTDDHEATLDGIIDPTEAGLTQLGSDIAAATDRAIVVQLCAEVAPDYRVYLVVFPQAHLTVAADRTDKAATIGFEVIAHLDAAIARAADAGADVAEAQSYRDAAFAHLETADADNDGVADAVLAVTPASFNDGSGADVLEGARTDLRGVEAELEAADQAARAAARALRDALLDLI